MQTIMSGKREDLKVAVLNLMEKEEMKQKVLGESSSDSSGEISGSISGSSGSSWQSSFSQQDANNEMMRNVREKHSGEMALLRLLHKKDMEKQKQTQLIAVDRSSAKTQLILIEKEIELASTQQKLTDQKKEIKHLTEKKEELTKKIQEIDEALEENKIRAKVREEMTLCIICCTNPRDTVIKPCGCMICCKDCIVHVEELAPPPGCHGLVGEARKWWKVRDCPNCRGKLEDAVFGVKIP